MVNYECAFSQSETEKYFRWTIVKNNSCSTEQAISYFADNYLLKQELLFSSMIFCLRSAEVFFTAYAIDSCHRLTKVQLPNV